MFKGKARTMWADQTSRLLAVSCCQTRCKRGKTKCPPNASLWVPTQRACGFPQTCVSKLVSREE